MTKQEAQTEEKEAISPKPVKAPTAVDKLRGIASKALTVIGLTHKPPAANAEAKPDGGGISRRTVLVGGGATALLAGAGGCSQITEGVVGAAGQVVEKIWDKAEKAVGKVYDVVSDKVDSAVTNLEVIWGKSLEVVGLREAPITLGQMKKADQTVATASPQDLNIADKVLDYLYDHVVQPTFTSTEYTETMLNMPDDKLQRLFTEWYMVAQCFLHLAEERNGRMLKAKYAQQTADEASDSPTLDTAEANLARVKEELENARSNNVPTSDINAYYLPALQKAQNAVDNAIEAKNGKVRSGNARADSLSENANQLRDIVSGLKQGELQARNRFEDAYKDFDWEKAFLTP